MRLLFLTGKTSACHFGLRLRGSGGSRGSTQIQEHTRSHKHYDGHGQNAPHEIPIEPSYVSMSHFPKI